MQFGSIIPKSWIDNYFVMDTEGFVDIISQFNNLKQLSFNSIHIGKSLYIYEGLKKQYDYFQCICSQEWLVSSFVVIKGPGSIILSSEFVEFEVVFK